MNPRRVVILGYGMAGARLADEIRRRDPDGKAVALTVIGDEPHAAYNRVLLSAVVAGTMHADFTTLHEDGWAEAHHVDLRTGVRATRIDRDRRVVVLAGDAAAESGAGLDTVSEVDTAADSEVDSEVPYDTLVFATGAKPWLPPVEGLTREDGSLAPGVVAFRTLDDCERIIEHARAGAPVAVLGGGLLGLEAARGLAGRGSLVTVVHADSHLMNRQLDPAAGRVLARQLETHGIDFRIGAIAAKYLPGSGLKLDDGSKVAAELVVVSAGVRAETELARDAGLTVDRGIVVDDTLRTSDGHITAIGDCAQHPGTEPGLVEPAWQQAEVLADLLTGSKVSARYRGTRVVTKLKARGIDLTALGEAHTDVHDADAEVLTLTDPTGGRYTKLVLRDDRVIGAILLGAPDAAATITQLHDRGVAVPADRLAVLLGRALPAGATPATGPADLPAAAVVCRCNSVTKRRLVEAFREGAEDVPALAKATRATTGCGSCREAVSGITDWLATTA